MKPSADPKADELRNKNLSEPAGEQNNTVVEEVEQPEMKEEIQNGEI